MVKMSEKKANSNKEGPSFLRSQRRQWVGMFGGMGIGLMLSGVIPWLRENLDFVALLLWSGAIGTAVMSIEQFEAAGAALTKRENRILNLAVSIGLTVLALLVLIFLVKNIFG